MLKYTPLLSCPVRWRSGRATCGGRLADCTLPGMKGLLNWKGKAMIRKRYKHIIWDWNGTLLDDVDIVIDAMNNLLSRRGLPLINRESYKHIFTFPVKDYYARLGFDFLAEPYEKLADEFTAEIYSNKYSYKLFPEVEKILEKVHCLGIAQSVLSASAEDKLAEMVDTFGIGRYFKAVNGLSNHYAHSKIEAGKQCLSSLGIKEDEVILIGDTVHDFEAAAALGCDCLLIANGHQSYARLKPLKAGLVNSLSEASELLL